MKYAQKPPKRPYQHIHEIRGLNISQFLSYLQYFVYARHERSIDTARIMRGSRGRRGAGGPDPSVKSEKL